MQCDLNLFASVFPKNLYVFKIELKFQMQQENDMDSEDILGREHIIVSTHNLTHGDGL